MKKKDNLVFIRKSIEVHICGREKVIGGRRILHQLREVRKLRRENDYNI